MSQTSITRKSLPLLQPDPTFRAVIDWIDRELGEVYGRRCGRGGNTLLELRRIFAERSLRRLFARFLALLPRLEKHHYLLAFRIRTLLSSQFRAKLSDPLERSPSTLFPLPQNAHSLRGLRRSYFEHSEVAIPFHDIRIEIVPSHLAL